MRKRTSGTLGTLVVLIMVARPVHGQSNATLVTGTEAPFATASGATKGHLDVIRLPTLTFTAIDRPLKGQQLSIPFENVTTIEAGETPGPKANTVALSTAAFGPGFLATRHGKMTFITVGYRDKTGSNQTVLFVAPPDFARAIIHAIEERSGKTATGASTSIATAPRPQKPSELTSVPVTAAPSLVGACANTSCALTNYDVIVMSQAGLSEEVIVLKIKAGPTAFDTSPANLIDLKRIGVSDRVLAAMIAGK